MKDIILASLMCEYAFNHGYSLLELQDYVIERVNDLNIEWDDDWNSCLDIIDSLYSHLLDNGAYDYSKYPFVRE